MRWLPMVLGVAAAFLMGAALAVVLQPRPAFRDMMMRMTGASVFDRCVKAGACNAVRSAPQVAPHIQRQEAPPDMDRA